MTESPWTVDFYENENGNCPTQEFLDDLFKDQKDDFIYIQNAFKELEKHGYKLRRPHVAPLRDHILEFIVKTNNKQYRFLFFYFHSKIIIITHGIVKKTRAVPSNEIEKARKYRNDYLSRNG